MLQKFKARQLEKLLSKLFVMKNNRGQAGIKKAVGMVMLILVVATLTPTIWGANAFGNATLFENAPAFLLPLLDIAAAIGLVLLLIPSE